MWDSVRSQRSGPESWMPSLASCSTGTPLDTWCGHLSSCSSSKRSWPGAVPPTHGTERRPCRR
eukprot:1013065-Alexandrium_andersonii.AAC.1